MSCANNRHYTIVLRQHSYIQLYDITLITHLLEEQINIEKQEKTEQKWQKKSFWLEFYSSKTKFIMIRLVQT